MNKLYALGAVLMMVGCATPGVNKDDQNQMIKEFYASVIDVTPVELSSDVRTGVAVGAGIGALDNISGDSGDMIGGAIVGALIGGIFTSIEEGSSDAFKYSLSSEKEGAFTLIQKERVDENARCVRVRVAKEVTLYAAPQSACNNDEYALASAE